MADKNYVVSLTVDDSGAVAAVNQMTTALDKADTSTQSLKAQLREMQQQLAKLDPNTEEFRKLSIEAGKVKDQIKDASEAINAQAGPAFETLGNNASLLRQRLFSLDFEGVGQSVKALAGNINNLKFGEASKGLGSLTSGFGALGKAILTNPLFLIGGVIALIVTNIENLTNRIPFLGAAFEAVGNVVGAVVQGFKDLTDWIGITENAAVDAANKSIELQDKTISDIDRNAKRQVALAKQLGQDVNEVTRQAEQQKLETYQKTIDEVNKINGKLTDDQIKAREDASNAIFDIETARIERQAEQNQKDIAAKEAREKQAQDAANARAEKAAQQAKERREKEKQEEIERQKQLAETILKLQQQAIDRIKALDEFKLQNMQEGKDKELAMLADKFDKEIAAAENNAELQKLLTEKYQNDQIAIDKKYALLRQEEAIAQQQAIDDFKLQSMQEGVDKELAILANKYDAEIVAAGENAELIKLITKKYQADVDAINQDAANKQMELDKRVQDAKIGYAVQGINALGGLLDAFSNKSKKNARANFQREKAFAIGTATMNTYLAASAALALKPSESLFPGQRFVEMGLAIAAGIAQVTKIASSKFNESGGGDAPSGGGGVPSVGGGGGNVGTVPTFNALNLGMLQNRPEQTPKAYVLAQDVSSAVEARDKVRDLARIN